MKGTIKPAPLNAADPLSMASRVYTDAHDQDWALTLQASGVIAAHPSSDAAHYYNVATSYIAASAPDFTQAAEALDGWVDQWDTGANPQPRIVTTATAKAGGGGLFALVLLAFLVLTDKKGRR